MVTLFDMKLLGGQVLTNYDAYVSATALRDDDRSLALTRTTNACCNGKAYHSLVSFYL